MKKRPFLAPLAVSVAALIGGTAVPTHAAGRRDGVNEQSGLDARLQLRTVADRPVSSNLANCCATTGRLR
jgi:hypothetical protein